MKTKLVSLCLVLTAVAAFAQTPTATKNPVVAPNPFQTEIESALASGVINLEVQGLYAPKLAQHWGAEVSVSHPVTDFASVGASAMLLNGGYYAGTFGVSFEKTFRFTLNLLGTDRIVKVTPRVRTGAYVPFKTLQATDPNANSQSTNGDFGAFVEPGTQLGFPLNASDTAEFFVGGNMKYISTFSGPVVQAYGGFAGITIRF